MPVLAGYDPGSRSSSLVILEAPKLTPEGLVPAFSIRPLLSTTRTVGRRIELEVPEVKTSINKATGEVKTWTKTWKWESSPGERIAHARELFELLRLHGVTELVIEQNARVHTPEGASAAAQSSIATNLRDAGSVAASLHTRCSDAGIRVHYVPMPTWRAKVAGKAHATDAEAREGVARYLALDLPADAPQPTTEHEVDALGVLLGHLLPPLRDRPARRARLNGVRRGRHTPSSGRKRAPGEPRYASKQDPSYLRHLEKIRERYRAAATARRVAAGLPPEVDPITGRAPYLCRKCGQPKAGTHARGLPCPRPPAP